MARLLTLCTLLLAVTAASAQSNSVQWIKDPVQAINLAKQLKRPLMVYVQASERYRDDQIDREHSRSFRNPVVVEKVHRNFVPLQLSRVRHRDKLEQFGFSQVANMEMTFVSPDGEILGRLSPQGIAQDESLLQKLSMITEIWGKKVYTTEVKPKLSDPETESKELIAALELVVQMRIKVAEQDVIKLLERPRLDARVRQSAYETLAELSTKPAVEKLLELAHGGDEKAAQALGKCTPIGAEFMLADLKADAAPFDYVTYKAITKICRISKPKSERFFENARQRLKDNELERVTKQVRVVVERWKVANE